MNKGDNLQPIDPISVIRQTRFYPNHHKVNNIIDAKI